MLERLFTEPLFLTLLVIGLICLALLWLIDRGR